MQKRAFITGVTGQDGSYLAELLLSKGYEVHGLQRRASTFNTGRIEHLYSNSCFQTHYGDLEDTTSLYRLLDTIRPDEIYNLGAMSHVKVSFEVPEYTIATNTLGYLSLLEWVRNHSPSTRIYQASSSEMFGQPAVEPPFNEHTPMMPQSPYGVSKLASYHLTRNYASGYGIYATTGILFNHESQRRGENFVTRKITLGVGKILRGEETKLYLGNLDAKRDWGHSKDYVEAIYTIMQQPKPDVYVVATGETHTVKEFVDEAFKCVNLNWEEYVIVDDKFKRPNEVPVLLGDASKIRSIGWEPKIKFKELVKMMVDNDIK